MKRFGIRFGALAVETILIVAILFPTPSFCHEPDPNDDTSLNSGGPDSNPYTVYSGGNGPGVCSKSGMPNYWVSTYSRELVVQDTDYRYTGLGPAVILTRTWNMPRNSSIKVYGMFGDRWTFSYEMSVDHAGQSESPIFRYVRLKKGSGQRLLYYIDLSSGAPPLVAPQPVGRHDRLTWYGGYWLFEEKSTRWTYRFDLVAGKNYCRLTSISDCNGNEVSFGYNADGTLDSITDAAGRVTDFTYDAAKHCTSMTIPDGRQATFQYDADGHLVGSADLLGSQTSFSYDSKHNLKEMTAAGKTTKFALDAEGKIQSVTDAGNNVWQYQKRAMGGIYVTDPRAYQTFYDSTQQGNTSMTMNMTLGTWTQTAYTNGLPSEHRDARGSITRYAYDARGNLTQLTQHSGAISLFEYDANDNLVKITDPLGNETVFTYDACHHVVGLISPLGKEVSLAYDALGRLTSTTNPKGKTSQYSYDAFGNLKTITDPLGNKTTFAYDQNGLRRIAVTDALGQTTDFAYDANDRLVELIHPLVDPLEPERAHRNFEYDCCAPSAQTDELGHTYAYERDALLNITALTDPLGNKDQRQYDSNGNLAAFTDALGRTATAVYNAGNLPASIVNPLGDSVGYGYDANGNPTSVTDERSKQTFFTYDSRDRLVRTTDPIGEQTTIAWDAIGRVASVTNARGCVLAFTHNADSRVTEKRHGGALVASYVYDDNGNLVSVTNAGGTTTFSYNDLDQVTAILYPDGLSVAFTYDAVGRLKTATYPGGLTVTYAYDARNRLVASDWDGKGITYELDAAGNLTRESRSNWTETLYTYDPADRVVGISHIKWGDTIAAVTYSRDKMGRTLSETRTPYVPPLFPGGTQPGAYNDVNQVVAFGGHAHTYDKDGNLIAVASPQGFSAAYDCENRMTSVTRGGIATAHSYDGLGNRVKSITGSAARNFHYDHLGRMLFETDGSKKVTARYIYAGNRLAAVETAGGNYFYHFDQAGSTLALTDGEGNVAASYSYLPFGAVASKTGTVVNPFTYVGAYGVMDEGEGLFFMRSRYYDADTGRFIQKDPAGMADGPNLYRYARNNPVDFIDPDGRQADPSDKELERMRSFATYNITSETVSRDVAPAEPDRDINLMEYGAHGAVAIGLLKVVKAMARSAGVREEDALELVLQEKDAMTGLLKTTFILEKLIELERYKERLSHPSKCDPPGPGAAEPDVSRGFADFE